MMRKRYFSTAGLVGAGLLGYFFVKNREQRKSKSQLEKKMTTMEKAGRPDQLPGEDIADLENAKMVSEGSQFGVQYYNELKNGDYVH